MPSSLFDERTSIGTREYEKLVQTLLWTSDLLWLPPQTRLDPQLDLDSERLIAERLDDFLQEGLVAGFDVESGISYESKGAIIPAAKRRETIPYEEYVQIFQRIRESTALYRERIQHRHSGQPPLEGVTEFVTLQSTEWTLCVAAALQADHSLTAEHRSTLFMNQLDKSERAVDLRAPAVQILMTMERIDCVSTLTTDQILNLRKYLPQVRQFIDKTVETVEAAHNTDRTPAALTEAVKTAVAQEYVDLLHEYRQSGPRKAAGLSIDAAITVLGFLWPYLAPLAVVKPIAEWIEDRHGTRRVITFHAKLHKITAHQQV